MCVYIYIWWWWIRHHPHCWSSPVRWNWVICAITQILTLCGETELVYIWVHVAVHKYLYMCTCYDGVDKAWSRLSVSPSVVKLGHLYGKIVLTLLVKQCIIYGDRRTVSMLLYPSTVKWVLREVNRLALCSKTEYFIYVYTYVCIHICMYMCVCRHQIRKQRAWCGNVGGPKCDLMEASCMVNGHMEVGVCIYTLNCYITLYYPPCVPWPHVIQVRQDDESRGWCTSACIGSWRLLCASFCISRHYDRKKPEPGPGRGGR